MRVAAASGPLADTAARLATVRPEYPHVWSVAPGVPDEPGWVGLGDVLADGSIAAWYDRALQRETTAGIASVAAVRVIGMLAQAVLGRLTAALVIDSRAHDVTATNLVVRLDEDGYLDRVAVRSPQVAVLPDDPAAAHPDAEIRADVDALLDHAASAAVAVLNPVIAQVRAVSRFGVVPAWSVAADSVLGTATMVPLYLGDDERAGRERGVALLDALVAHGARVRTRGTSLTLRRAGTDFELPVRGSCCFYYKTEPETEAPGDEYCGTCPLLEDELRTRRLGVLLDDYVLPARAAR